MEQESALKSLQKQYLSLHDTLRRNGLKNKVMLILLSLPASIYAYFEVNAKYEEGNWEYPHHYLYFLSGLVCLMIVTAILSVNSISFINAASVRNVRFRFKKELFQCIQKLIPEIKEHRFDRKIHPRYFTQSGLFKAGYSDYLGDDLFSGVYQDCRFDICELHVFKLFKSVFDGLFVHIYNLNLNENLNGQLVEVIETYRNQLPEDVHIQGHVAFMGDVYLAFHHKSSLFEKNNSKEIRALDQDVLVLDELIQLIKQVVEFSHRNQQVHPIQI